MRVAIFALTLSMWSATARADGVVGTWSGSLDLAGQHIAFSVTFTATDKATIDIPSQGAQGLALDNVTVTGKEIRFSIAKVGAVMKGTLDGDAIKGTLDQGGQSFPFTMSRSKSDGYKLPPPPRKPLTSTAGARLIGTWKGDSDGVPVTVELHDDHGMIAGSSSGRNTCIPIPLQNITLTFDKIHVEQLGTIAFDGKITGDTVTGISHQGADVPFKLTREHAVAAVDKPYTEIELSIPSTNGTTLAATLTMPKGAPAPVVVTITGSGPQDRDECVLGIRPFGQLADYLARHGVATLRYDDRGTAKSTGDFTTATAADFADDAQAAVTFLASRTDVDPKRIGLLGHSEGGIIAPMVAARDKDVAFVVMWAGPGLPLDQVIVRQTGEGLKAEGMPADKVAKQVAIQDTLWKLWRVNKERAKFKAAFAATAKKLLDKATLDEIGNYDTWVDTQVAQLWSPWFLWYRDYDPKATLRKVTVPVLAINGALDKQVDPTLNLPVIKAALAKNKDVSIVELPGLNHVFQATKTGAVSEYAKNPPEMDGKVLDVTTSWIRKHTGLE